MDDRYPTDAELTFLKELSHRKVRFLVVGMAAAVMQGSDRSTDDIDLWFASLSDPGIDEAARAAGGVFAWRANPPMIVGKDLQNIDILRQCNGLRTFDREYDHALEIDLCGVAVKVLPLARVIISKEACGRLKDKAAIPSLLATLIAIRHSKK